MRSLLLAAFCWIGATNSFAQQTSTVQKSQTNTSDAANDEGHRTLVVYRLRNIRSTDAVRLIKDLGIGGVNLKIAEDAQTNSIVVSCREEAHQEIEAVLKQMDRASELPKKEEEAPVQLLRFPSPMPRHLADLVAKYSEVSEVGIAFDQETGVVMIRGDKSPVQKTLLALDEMQKIAQKIAIERVERDAGRSRRPVALRIFWLTNQPQANSLKSDTELSKIIDRLGGLGFEGLRVGMHLVARCDLAHPGTSSCMVEGREQIEEISRKLSVQAKVKSEDGSDIIGELQIRTSESSASHRAPVESSVLVDVNLAVKKYYVLAAAPLGRHHSVFVVQYIDDL